MANNPTRFRFEDFLDEGFETTESLDKAIYLFRDGTLWSGFSEGGDGRNRDIDHGSIEAFLIDDTIDRYHPDFWSMVMEELVQVIPETQTILTLEGGQYSPAQTNRIDELVALGYVQEELESTLPKQVGPEVEPPNEAPTPIQSVTDEQGQAYHQLIQQYGLVGDVVFEQADWEKIFGWPEHHGEKEILEHINQHRQETLFSQVYNGIYTMEDVEQYNTARRAVIQRQLSQGQRFFQLDQKQEVLLKNPTEEHKPITGFVFSEDGECSLFHGRTVEDAATQLVERGANPCSKGSLSIVSAFLSNTTSRGHQQHLLHNQVMQDTYLEETGRSMTGRA